MKNGFIKKLISGALTAAMCVSGFQTIPNASAADQTDYKTIDGYDYELWNQWGQGSASMQCKGGDGAYSCSWQGIENVLFRSGKKLKEDKKTYDQYEGIYIEYDVDYQPIGNSYMCVYGWTENNKKSQYPTVEYYIVEGWGSWRPPGNNAQSFGSFEVNGNSYDIYRTIRENQPSINGNETFYQYWSVRDKNDNPAVNGSKTHMEGTISVSDHFAAWEAAGLDMSGTLYEVALNVEGYQSNGSADVNKNKLVFGNGSGDGGGGGTTTEPDENGYYFYNDFENDNGKWGSRGDAKVDSDTKSYYEGAKSLAVSGRKDTWQGTAINLSNKVFAPGNTYSFGTGVLQNSGEAADMMLTLQYTDSNGKEQYTNVATASAESGVWTKLENTSFTIPTGATGMILYVESADTTMDFNIDNAYGAVEGKKSDVETGKGTVNGKKSEGTTTTTAATTTTTKITTTTTKTTENVTTTTIDNNKLWGDANVDGNVTVGDAVAILQHVALPDKYALTDEGEDLGDVFMRGDGITAMDALAVVQYDAKVVIKLPVSYKENPQETNLIPDTTTAIKTTTIPVTAISSITIASDDFENGLGDWESRGNTILSLDNDSYYSGSQSVNVSGRSDTWQGIALNGSDLKAGETYSFSAAVMQASGSPVDMMITLQYNDADGKESYSNIAKATADDKTWTKLENTEYTIPEGATNLLVYIETADVTCAFNIDDAVIASAGTKSAVVTGEGTVNIVVPEPKEGVDISWIDPNKPMVAISFDDGAVGSAPTDYSMRIINAIADQGFHATFFYVGDWINGTSDENEVKYAYSKGMEIANHSTTHPELPTLSAQQIRAEFDTTHAKLKSIIGAEPSKLLRLPYLKTNSTVESTLNDVALISCSVDTGDWNKASKDQIVNTIKTAMNNGTLDNAIVLCHETYDTTASAMEELAPYLKEQGWQIVTISEMFAVNGKELKGGTVYRNCN